MIQKGMALFFNRRLLHNGPKCGDDRWVLFHNWVPKEIFKYYDYPALQYRSDLLLKMIHRLDSSKSRKEFKKINVNVL